MRVMESWRCRGNVMLLLLLRHWFCQVRRFASSPPYPPFTISTQHKTVAQRPPPTISQPNLSRIYQSL